VSIVRKSLGAWWTDRRSLRWKLPWLFALTATAAVATFGFVAYGAVRRVALDTAVTRLRSALSQVRTIQELGVLNQLSALQAASQDTALIAALRHRTSPLSESAMAALTRLKGVSDSSVVVELIDRRGVVRQALPSGSATGVPLAQSLPALASIGPIQQDGDMVFFESTVALSNGADTLGTIRITRPLRNGVNRRLVANLVDGAVLLMGNMDGTMWGDSGRSVYPETSSLPERYVRLGERWLSLSSPVGNTPWVYAVELPDRLALAPARALIVPFTLAGVLIALGAALTGVRLSQRITRPLAELTLATEGIAGGAVEVPPIESTRDDEIGRLARAFSTMAGQVRAKRDTLEQEITRRTGELSIATNQLLTLNEELRESEKLATLGRLSGSAGHELRNPLGVLSNIGFLIDAMPDAYRTPKDYAD
jgi:C4-dicarboxylate-specific signal transduction histidine kinase